MAKLITATVAAALLLAPAAADARHRCKVRHAKVVDRTKHGVVFEKVKPEPDSPSGTATFTYGCLYRKGRIRRLPDDPADFIQAREPRLVGRYVGFEKSYEEGQAGFFARMVVFDLRTGRVAVDRPAMTDTQTNLVEAFVLKLDGSVAWIGRDEEQTGKEQVWKVDREAPNGTVLDSGPPEIDVRSLRLSRDRNTVLWRKDEAGTPHDTDDDTQKSAPID